MARTRLMTMLGAAALAAGACSRPAPSVTDDALRQDLDAAQAHASAAQTARTQFVSPLELGHTAEAPARSTPRLVLTAPAATHPAARRAATPVTRVARVLRPARAEHAEREASPAPAEHAHASAPVAERTVDAPSIDVEVAPLPAPSSRDEPVVAAPTRHPADVPSAPRRGRVWTTGDVIRNAPFPINP